MSLAQNASPLNDDYMITRRSFGGLTFAVAPATTRYLSLEHFGASGPYARLADEFGFTPANCLRLARELL